MNEAEIWKLYADLINTKDNKVSEDYLKMINNLQKAHRIATQEPNWERTVERCKKVTKWAVELAEGNFKFSSGNFQVFEISCILFSAQVTYHSMVPLPQGNQQLNSAKLMLKSLVVKIRVGIIAVNLSK